MTFQVDQVLEQQKAPIREWFQEQKAKLSHLPAPLYSSFDLRDNGYKSAIIDSNVFPAGFNNLNERAQKCAVDAFSKYLPSVFSGTEILIIPETHTRNLHYLRNLNVIQSLLNKAGYEATIGHLQNGISNESLELIDSVGEKIVLEKLFRKGQKLRTASFSDGLILLNNDFSIPPPSLLDNLNQIILPPINMSWTHRKKSSHFIILDKILHDFSQKFDTVTT